MRLEHSFTVPTRVDEAWDVLLDLPRVAPCMPGATLTGVADDTFTGTVKVKLGPIGLTYSGKGRFVTRDEADHRVVVQASGRDTRSAGTASAIMTAVLVPEGEATRVEVTTELTVTGRPAQFGRSMIADVGAKLIGQFADCLAGQLGRPAADAVGSADRSGPPAALGAVAEPAVGGSPAAVRAGAAQPTGGLVPPATVPEQVPEPPTAPGSTVAVQAPTDVEPIDLLRLTGGTPAVRRLAGYGLAAVVVVALARILLRWLRR